MYVFFNKPIIIFFINYPNYEHAPSIIIGSNYSSGWIRYFITKGRSESHRYLVANPCELSINIGGTMYR